MLAAQDPRKRQLWAQRDPGQSQEQESKETHESNVVTAGCSSQAAPPSGL